MIQSKLMTLSEVLNYRFIIPPFQRPFEWDDSKEGIKRITNFISTIIEDVSGQKQTPQCFLGNIVLCATEKSQCYKVIDGAQRLNMLLLLLTTIHSLSKDSNTLLTIKNKLYNLYHQSSQPEVLIPIDSSEFMWVNQLPDYSNTKNNKLLEAQKIITAQLQHKLTGNAIDLFFNRMMAIVHFNVLEETEASKENESHHLFEVINSGLPLSEVDILRGKLFEYKINDLTKFKTLFIKYPILKHRNKFFKLAICCSTNYAQKNTSTKTVTMIGTDKLFKDYFLSSDFEQKLKTNPDFVTHLINVDSKITSFYNIFIPKIKYNGTDVAAALLPFELAINQKLSPDENKQKEHVYNIFCLLSQLARVGTTAPLNGVYPSTIYALLNASSGIETIKILKQAAKQFLNVSTIREALDLKIPLLSYIRTKEVAYLFMLIEEYLLESCPNNKKHSLPASTASQVDHIYSKAMGTSIPNIDNIGNLTLLESKLNLTKTNTLTFSAVQSIYAQSSFALTSNCLQQTNIPIAYNTFNTYCQTKIKQYNILATPALISNRAEFIKNLFFEALEYHLS